MKDPFGIERDGNGKEIGVPPSRNTQTQTTERKAPRTDAHYGRLPNDRQTRGSVQDYEHAAKLESELVAKDAELACCKRMFNLSDVESERIAELEAELRESRKQVARLRDALVHVLPMARGYANHNDVGANWLIIGDATDLLASLPDQAKEKP